MTRRVPLIGIAFVEGEQLRLPNDSAHYLRDVLRLISGAEVELFNGKGDVALARLAVLAEEVMATILSVSSSRVSGPVITLFTAIPKGDRWTYLLEKCTEVGVTSIQPILTQRSVVKPSQDRAEKQLRRWQKVIEGAARQSLRTFVPAVSAPISLAASLKIEFDARWIANPNAATGPSNVKADSIGIWIGPEGGFTEQELKMASDAGAQPLSLGPHVLRVETAALVAVFLLNLGAK